MALTPKQQRFVDEYLVDLNATQAAIRAGYSEKTAHVIGAENLGKPEIAAAVASAQQKRSDRTGVKADQVLAELAVIGFSSVEHYTTDDEGRLVLAEGAPASAMRAVSSVKLKTRTIRPRDGGDPETVREVEFRLWDKNTALANLGKHLGMFVDAGRGDGDDAPAPVQVVVTVRDASVPRA